MPNDDPAAAFFDAQARALDLAAARDGVLLTREARDLGLTRWAIDQLRRASEPTVVRGALAIPPLVDPVRTSARAVQLLLPAATISHRTAARLHELQGLAYWEPDEPVEATLPPYPKRWQRQGVRLYFRELAAGEVVDHGGMRLTAVRRTLMDCASLLDRTTFLALADTALRREMLTDQECAQLSARLSRSPTTRHAAEVLRHATRLSESPSESRARLVLIDADLAPDFLQYEVYTPSGFQVARLDMAYLRNGRKVGFEIDSAEHDRLRALYRDRDRLNALRGLGWDVRQITAHDAKVRPGYIVQQARQALGL